jgi:glycosyltransferase involved in cell wall biosynthesis
MAEVHHSVPLLLVSANAGERLRAEVAAGARPRTEYLELERRHGMEILDWSRLGHSRRRTRILSLRHVAAALPRLRRHTAVFSDGEHLGIPLALAMSFGHAIPHVVIGHWLTRSKKRAFFKVLKAHRRMTRILVHSRTQLELAARELGIPRERMRFVPYSADTEFWRPQVTPQERLVVSAGLEHRDYATLDAACARIDCDLSIAAASLHTPHAICTMPPATSKAIIQPRSHLDLRDLYARASVVAVPLVPNDFQAGVTTLLEAMAMGKAVVVSATQGQRDVVVDGETGLMVPPDNPQALAAALRRLLDDPGERARLGRNARRAVENSFSLEAYVDAIAASLEEAAGLNQTVVEEASAAAI